MIRRAAGLTLLLCLVACADNPQAPIEERSAGRRPVANVPVVPVKPDYGSPLKPGANYRVQRGDTLYAIAFRLGMDFQTLAAINGITKPYVIKIGQSLKTVPPKSTAKPTSTKSVAKTSSSTGAAKTPASGAPTVAKTKPSTTQSRSASAPKSSSAGSSTSRALGTVRNWRWPSTGKVVRSYSDNLHKGIDISGRRGDAVRAVAAGVVVYAGTGVTGYGALLIVKHNDEYLSAYGHNDALLVKEGTYVEVGEKIARVGSTGTDTVKLHFEIRRNGKPVDPLKLLPKR